jgi:hypothetical protein
MAVQFSLLRYPGIGLRFWDETPLALVQFPGQQIGAPWPVFHDYARRDTTRREHFGEAAERLGLRVWASAAVSVRPSASSSSPWQPRSMVCNVPKIIHETLDSYRKIVRDPANAV